MQATVPATDSATVVRTKPLWLSIQPVGLCDCDIDFRVDLLITTAAHVNLLDGTKTTALMDYCNARCTGL